MRIECNDYDDYNDGHNYDNHDNDNGYDDHETMSCYGNLQHLLLQNPNLHL